MTTDQLHKYNTTTQILLWHGDTFIAVSYEPQEAGPLSTKSKASLYMFYGLFSTLNSSIISAAQARLKLYINIGSQATSEKKKKKYFQTLLGNNIPCSIHKPQTNGTPAYCSVSPDLVSVCIQGRR